MFDGVSKGRVILYIEGVFNIIVTYDLRVLVHFPLADKVCF